MYRRYHPRRTRPLTFTRLVAGVTVGGLLLWFVVSKGGQVVDFFRGSHVVVASNEEANARLSALMADLGGDKARLLDLAMHEQERLGWIADPLARTRVRTIMVARLVDLGQWEEAAKLIPSIMGSLSAEELDRLAAAADRHKDFARGQSLDRRLQQLLLSGTENTDMLLRSLRRSAESCIAANKQDEAVKIISQLDAPGVLARLSSPDLAAEAAALQMVRAGVSEVQEPVLQLVRNILESAKWPACPVAAHLMLDEVNNTLRDNPGLSATALKEIEDKLLRCRSLMMEFPDKEHRMADCYALLGEVRNRLGDYDGCSQALSLASAFAESQGVLTPEMELKLHRVRTHANETSGDEESAVRDHKWLLDHETDPAQVFRSLAYLTDHCEGSERAKMLERCWSFLDANPRIAQANPEVRPKVAETLIDYYKAKGDYTDAIKWLRVNRDLVEAANPDITNGLSLKAKYDLALAMRKAKQDTSASAALYQICESIENMDADAREKLNAAAPRLYKDAVREYARTRYIMGDTARAKSWAKKIDEGLPDKER